MIKINIVESCERSVLICMWQTKGKALHSDMYRSALVLIKGGVLISGDIYILLCTVELGPYINSALLSGVSI